LHINIISMFVLAKSLFLTSFHIAISFAQNLFKVLLINVLKDDKITR
jgi:hypothetical protein